MCCYVELTRSVHYAEYGPLTIMVSGRQSNTAINYGGLVINNVLGAIKDYNLIYINIYNIICTPSLASSLRLANIADG